MGVGFFIFEFGNGTISDGNAEQAAEEKIKTLRLIVMGLVDRYNLLLSKNNAGFTPEELQNLRIDEIKSRADAQGNYEVVGACGQARHDGGC